MARLTSAKNSMIRARMFRPATSMVNEPDCGGSEFGVVLKDRAVTGVGLDGCFGATMGGCMSRRTVGTMRAVSPFVINVGWVIMDRSADVERPERLVALSWVRKGFT